MSYLELAKKVEARLKGRQNAAVVQISEPEPLGVIDGTVQAVLIGSEVLHADIWLILRPGFIPTDGLAVYYAEEILRLKGKTSEELKEIHKYKLRFPGCRVRR